MSDWQQKLEELGIEEYPGTNGIAPFLPAEIEQLESHYRAKLPETYRSFLALYGYSYLPRITQINFGPDMASCCYAPGAFSSSTTLLNFEVLDSVFPKQVIAFSHDEFGNSCCISLRPDTFGKIYLYNQHVVPPTSAVSDEEQFKCLEYLAESFEEWVEKLFVEDDSL